jgi:hypothetical protein
MLKLIPLLVALGVKFKINNTFHNCEIIEIDVEQNTILIERDYFISIKYLIKGRSQCYLDINRITNLNIDIHNNTCNIIYEN